jgi:hypothetical protein
MRRLIPLLVFLAVSGSAAANGCPAPCSGQISSPDGEQLLYVQPEGVGGPVHAYDPATGGVAFTLPAGITAASGRAHVTARAFRYGTVVSRQGITAGPSVNSSVLVDGRWQLAGVAPNGRFASLARQARDRSRTQVRVVDLDRRRVAHRLDLGGDFEVETVSNDGRRLFLIEHVGGEKARYRVRLFDLSRVRLASKPLRGDGEPAVMAGYASSAVGSPDGRWLLTLYLNTARKLAFVHALDLVTSKPTCIFLPGNGPFEALRGYSLTLSPDGRRLYAANTALGVLSEIDLAARKVARTVRFAGGERPGAGPPLTGTISRSGRMLYFSGGRNLWAYDAAFGVVRGPYATGGRLSGYGFGLGDRRIHALRTDGRLLSFDAATGRRIAR